MTLFLKLERDLGEEIITFQPVLCNDGTFSIKVQNTEHKEITLLNFPKRFTSAVVVDSMTLLKSAKLTLKDHELSIEPSGDESNVWGVWLSVFPEGSYRVIAFRDSALKYLKDAKTDDLESILQFARCLDWDVKLRALVKIAKIAKIEMLSMEQRALLYDFNVDTRFESVPISSVWGENLKTPEDIFWKNYCLQAITRIPKGVQKNVRASEDVVSSLVAQIGFRAFKILNHEQLDPNPVFFKKIRASLVCRGGHIKNWYEEYRYWSALGYASQAEEVKPKYKVLSEVSLSCRNTLQKMEDKEYQSWVENLAIYVLPQDSTYKRGKGEDLMDQVEQFLASKEQKIFLLQGDSGVGKTTFARVLCHQLFLEQSEYIPIYLSLPMVGGNVKSALEKKLERIKLDIDKLKESQSFLFILDGYDELALHLNIYTSNKLHEWENSKCLITCRSQYLSRWEEYKTYFIASETEADPYYKTFLTRYLAPFDEQQIQHFLAKAPKAKNWELDRYQDALAILPQELVSNPFLLHALAQYLPDLDMKYNGAPFGRGQIYETLIQKRIEKDLDQQLNDSREAKYTPAELKEFSKQLALIFWRQGKTMMHFSVSQYNEDLGEHALFKLNALSEKGVLLRHADAILNDVNGTDDNEVDGSATFEFIHKSVMDYLFAEILYFQLLQAKSSLADFGLVYLSDHSMVVDFFVEKLRRISDNEREYIVGRLFELIEASKIVTENEVADDDNDNDDDETVVKASSNAATLLARAGIAFSGKDLRGARLIHANLNGGIFHHTDLRGAVLKYSELHQAQLVNTLLQSADLAGVKFTNQITKTVIGSPAKCIAPHPTKPLCAVGLCNGIIEVWDRVINQRTALFKGHQEVITSVCFSPDGQHIVSGSWDKAVRQWSMTSGESTHIFEGHQDAVTSVCYSPDGLTIFSGSRDGKLRQWKVSGGPSMHIYAGHFNAVTSICLSSDGQHIVSGCWDNTLRLWSVVSRATINIFKGHTEAVTCVSLSPDGQRIVSGSKDKTMFQWSISNGEATHIFVGHQAPVRSVCYSPDGQYVLSGSTDGTVCQWSASTGRPIHVFVGHADAVTSVGFSTIGQQIFSVSVDMTLRQWSTYGVEYSRLFLGHTDGVMSVCFSPDGQRILSGSIDETVRQWSVQGGVSTHLFTGHQDAVSSVCYHPDGLHFLSGSFDKSIHQWVSTEEEATHIFRGHRKIVASIGYSPDGLHFLSGSFDNTVRQWKCTGGKAIHIFRGHRDRVTSVSFSPDGEWFISGSNDNTVRQWMSIGGNATHIFRGHEKAVMNVCYSPDGERFISGSIDRTIRQWKCAGGDATHIFKGHRHWVSSVCYSPHGELLLSGSWDKTARIWDANSTDCLCVLKGHHNNVESVAWSVKNVIATASADHTIAVWRKFPDSLDNQQRWGMIWRSGYTPISAFGCQIDDKTQISPANRKLLEQGS